MIRSLSTEVQAQLRSGIAIFSLQQCVEELLLNSIDAGATCVAVQLDIEACRVQVIDNGSGMEREDMEKVGMRYCTSKCSSLEDLDNLRFYGFRGEAIASMVSLSAMVEISSRTRGSIKTFVKTFNEGEASDVYESRSTRPSAGTTVLICNFFHNMPVRRKRLNCVLEVERVRQRVEALSLMQPAVSFTVRRDGSDSLLVQIPKARNTYYRFAQIHGSGKAQKLREVNHTHGQFEMTGHIGREGHYNNSLQFLFVNGRLLLKTRIHKLLGHLLRRLSNGASGPAVSPRAPSVLSSPKQRGGTDSYGVYVINLKCHYAEYDICLEPAKSLIEFRDWDAVALCVEGGVKAFLMKENLTSEWSLSENIGQGDVPTALESSPLQDRDASPSVSRHGNREAADGADKVQRTEPISMMSIIQKQTRSDSETEAQNESRSSRTAVVLNKSVGKATKRLKMEGDGDATRKEPCSKNSRIVMIDPEDTHDSLRRFTDLTKSCAAKRTLPPLPSLPAPSHTTAPKIAPRKLTLAFETGSLDKFKRLFEEGLAGNRSTASQTKSSTGATRHAGRNFLPTQAEVVNTKPDTPSNCSPKSDRTSLAAKLCQKLEGSLPHQGEFTETQETESGPNPEKHDPELGVTPGDATTTWDDQTFSSPHRQNPPTPGTPREEAERTKYMTSPKSDRHSGQIFDLASKPDPPTLKTGNGDEAAKGSHGTRSDGGKPASSDWLTFYDDSLGRSVYVNRVTGLSKYDAPSLEEPDVPCTTDVTNMAVSVVSKAGFEYRCYPFQTNLVLPFLPKPRAERSHSAGGGNGDRDGVPGSLSTLLAEWSNPVFLRPPQVAMDVTCGQAEGLAVKIHNILFPYRFTKDMIHSMTVINQVDRKFLACLMSTAERNGTARGEGNLLVLVDQHAAHERVRLEGLVTESFEDDPDVPGEKRLSSSSVSPPLEVSVTEEEIRLLRSYQPFLKNMALEISFPSSEALSVFVERLPVCFMEKENTERRRGRRSIIKALAEEYLREHMEFLQTTGRVKGSLPLTVHSVLASQACHGAIKFNDKLSAEECCSLVASLSSCQLPFQCAHGRPSILPIADLLHLEDEPDRSKPNLRKLRRMYKSWQLYGT